MNVETSNRLTELAGRIRQASDRAKVASVEAAGQYLEAGRLLIEAKAECRHGDWLPFLAMAEVSERQAQRLMKLARSGLQSDAVSDLGGVTAALEYLAEKKQPEPVDVDTYLHGPRPYEPGEIEVPVADVVFRRNLYPRMQFRPDIVDRYEEFLPDLPPIEVNQRSELIDGWHRLEAHKQAGVTTIRAVVTGVENDIEHLMVAIRRNSRHGEQLPMAVERKASRTSPEREKPVFECHRFAGRTGASIMSMPFRPVPFLLLRSANDIKEIGGVGKDQMATPNYYRRPCAQTINRNIEG